MGTTAVLAFFGAVVGAFLTGVATEAYKRHQERHGTASAIGAEISSILEMTRLRDYVNYYTGCAAKLRVGQPVTIADILKRPLELDPIISGLKDRIGVLGGDLPGRVVLFYSRLMGIRLDVMNLADGKFDADLQIKAGVIEEDLKLWKQTVADANRLCTDLRLVAAESWLADIMRNWFRLLVALVAAWAAYEGIIAAIDRAPFLTPEYGLLWERSGAFLLSHIFGVALVGSVVTAVLVWRWTPDTIAWLARR